jgi:nucleotide-binding universal stress UspA family protein
MDMDFDKLNRILVATDFSEASQAGLRAAIRLAKTFPTPIEVFHVDIDPSLVLPPPADLLSTPLVFERVVAGAAEQLEQVVDEVRRAGVECTGASELGRTHTTIVEHARRIGAGLIVMGTAGRHGLSHALLGSVAEKVVQHAPCPVLVVPAGTTAAHAGSKP